MAFNGQPALEDVQTFVQTHIHIANTYNAGGANYIVNGHSVYSYKVSGSVPTPPDHVIDNSLVLSNAFLGTSSASTTPVPIDTTSAFTTYIIGFDVNGNVIEGGPAGPVARYWRVVYGGPFYNSSGTLITSAPQIQQSAITLQSGLTDLDKYVVDSTLPPVTEESKTFTAYRTVYGSSTTLEEITDTNILTYLNTNDYIYGHFPDLGKNTTTKTRRISSI